MVTMPPSCGKTFGVGDGSLSHELNPLQKISTLPAGTPAPVTTGTFTTMQQNCVIVPLTVKPVPVLVNVRQSVAEAHAPSKTDAEVVGGGNWAWHGAPFGTHGTGVAVAVGVMVAVAVAVGVLVTVLVAVGVPVAVAVLVAVAVAVPVAVETTVAVRVAVAGRMAVAVAVLVGAAVVVPVGTGVGVLVAAVGVAVAVGGGAPGPLTMPLSIPEPPAGTGALSVHDVLPTTSPVPVTWPCTEQT